MPSSDNTPADLVARLLANIRGQFCPDLTDKQWYSDHNRFIRAHVVLWPARFMTSHGFTLPAARYEQIMLAILHDIKIHGQTGAVRYWPGYLMKCVQDHWRHHWEDYYQEAKSLRTIAERAMLACQTLPPDRTVDTLSEAYRLLTKKRVKKATPPKQLGLL